MSSQILKLAANILMLLAMSASAAIRYVDVNSASPAPPYTNSATAATTIQDAVDAAVAGDQILVTNGVYQTGGRVMSGTMTNRVAVDKPVTVQSVNGAVVTVIRGFQMPGTTNGDSAIRCVYLTNGAALVGFTLTNGATRSSGDEVREQRGGGVWCESASAVVSNCVLTGNSAGNGGGAIGGSLNNCTVTENSGYYVGGGAFNCTLNNCTLTDNLVTSYGAGGGAFYCTLNNCALTGNSAAGYHSLGGGAFSCTLNNCTLTGNSATGFGGAGGGAFNCALNNCIVYYNHASGLDNYSESVLNYSCTTPLPPAGVGNISAEPQMADLSHLRAGSPCRGAGSAAYATGRDIDGETWANPPSIGCDEYDASAVTGPLSVSIQTAYTNVIMGCTVNFTAAFDGHAAANRWEFDDGTVVSNRPYASHSWAVLGDYSVVFQVYNDTFPGGVGTSVTVRVVAQPVHYVAVASPHPVAPYTSWATAASNIQDAVDAVSVPGALVLVSNGVYQTGERVLSETLTNRVVVDKLVTVQSVNGAAVTVIQGDPATRCVVLGNGAALVGFTLTNGVANGGGGVLCESLRAVVSNCVLTGNQANGYSYGGGAAGGTLNNCTLTANYSGYPGGGASDCTLNNCTLARNSTYYGGGGASGCTLNNCALFGNSSTNGYGGGAFGSTLANCTLNDNSASDGGGAWDCTLNNCTVTGNSASYGGGVSRCTLNNCIVYYNSIDNGQNSEEGNYLGSVMSYSCTTPLPSGIGNLTKAPLFVDYAGGNLRLQSNSPCINAGANTYAPAGPDLDGNPRIVGGTVDIGAYEFQAPQSRISYAWLQQYNLPTDGSADNTDPDSDGLNTWQEWRAGTDPTNALSVLRLLRPTSGASGVIVSWQSVSGRNYFIKRATDLGAQPLFLLLATNIVGQSGTTIFKDTNSVGVGPYFYRVGVQE